MSNIAILGAPHRTYSEPREGRDYLSVGDEPQSLTGRKLAQVINFRAPLEQQCGNCGRHGHRASKCPLPPPSK